MNPNCSNDRKIAVVGKKTVGKSSLVRQYIEQRIYDRYFPSMDREFMKIDHILETDFHIEIHDSAGYEEGTYINPAWVGTIDAFIIMYAINDRNSFVIAQQIREKLAYAMGNTVGMFNIPIILLGNKRDLAKSEREVTTQEAKKLVKTWHNAKFAEITCKNYNEVQKIVAELIEIHETKSGNYKVETSIWQNISKFFKQNDQQIHIDTKC
jgi:Ras family protein